MTPRERAERSEQLLADEVLKGAFDDIRANLVSKLETLPIGDVDTQHEIALMLQLLKQIRAQLAQYVQGQKLDEHKAKEEKFLAKMRERYIG
jgi:hypothetical protein